MSTRPAYLVLNVGSSSLKFSVFTEESHDLRMSVRGQVEGLPETLRFFAKDAHGEVVSEREWRSSVDLPHHEAIEFLLRWSQAELFQEHPLVAVGHRVAHGGLDFPHAVRVDREVLRKLEALVPLAPLHQPHNLSAIRTIGSALPDLPQVACFDTSFHRCQASLESTYAIPRHLTEAGVRRYGFHGLSYEYIASCLPQIDARAAAGRTVVAHLGNGASMCAIRNGQSVASTMGFTALDGIPMGTRCGALDPGVLLYLIDERKMEVRQVERMLYKESGLLGVSTISNDMRTLLQSNDPHAVEAVEMFIYRIARELGSLSAALQGLDALVFTAGIGENSDQVRAGVCRASEWLGIRLDDSRNEIGGPLISSSDSDVAVWVIPTDEELMIARHTQRVLARSGFELSRGASSTEPGR